MRFTSSRIRGRTEARPDRVGGELSRIMLALKTSTSDAMGKTLIFEEATPDRWGSRGRRRGKVEEQASDSSAVHHSLPDCRLRGNASAIAKSVRQAGPSRESIDWRRRAAEELPA